MSLTQLRSRGILDGTITAGDFASGVGGKVLQVVTATDSTQRSTTSTSYVTDSNTLSVSITPSSASNKVFIQVYSVGYKNTSDSAYYTIFRGATNLAGTGKLTMFNVNDKYIPFSMSYLDSPNTTSATTYQVYFKMTGAAPTVYLNATDNGSELTVGTITAFEIAG